MRSVRIEIPNILDCIRIITTLCLLTLLVGPATAGTWYVAEGGNDANPGDMTLPLATIQAAIDSSAVGDEVLVMNGTYTGTGNRDIDFLGKNITVRSFSDDPDSCIIDCQGSLAEPHRGFYFGGLEDSSAVLRGLTIKNGYDTAMGGGILIQWSGTDLLPAPLVENCILTGNEALIGAGLSVYNQATPDFLGCRVEDNIGPGASWHSDPLSSFRTGTSQVDSCRFDRNQIGAEVLGSKGKEPGIVFKHSSFTSNDSIGFLLDGGYIGAALDSCTIDGNGSFGLWLQANGAKADLPPPWALESYAYNSTISNNGGVGIYCDSEVGGISGCTITDNGGHGIEMDCEGSGDIEDNWIQGNSGHGILAGVGFLTVVSNQIFDNDLDGLHITSGVNLDIRTNVIHHNIDNGMTLDTNLFFGLEMVNNTITHNTSHGIVWDLSGPLDISGNIVAFNGLKGAEYIGGDVPSFDNCNIFGNGEGNWDGPIATQFGFTCNISEDPLFCDPENGDFTLRIDSPCLTDEDPCGPIGALGVGCFPEAPLITAVTDIPNDQGLQVRLSWYRSEHDALGSAFPILGYGIYRYEGELPVPELTGHPGDKLTGWDYLDTVPARGDTAYQFVAPTLCDSTITDGPCLSHFLVSAMTSLPLVFFDSMPDSGYSLDNLAPLTPSGLMVAFANGQNDLVWDAPIDDDVSHFNVHRSMAGATLKSVPDTFQIFSTHWSDTALPPGTTGWDFTYQIEAVDLAGNTSPLTNWNDSTVSDVHLPESPTALVLHPNVPNPFNPRTTIRFDLPKATEIRLRIFDLSGKLIHTLKDGQKMDAGTHGVKWEGRNGAGQNVPAGVYIYQLDAGHQSRTGRMTLLK